MSAEEQRNTPNAGKTDKRIDDAADDTALSAEQPSNQIELKNTDQAPVQRTDDAQDQCNRIRKNPSYFSGVHSMDYIFGQYSQKYWRNL